MRIIPPLADMCIQSGAVIICVEDCEGEITWEWTTPDGQQEPAIVELMGDGKYSVIPFGVGPHILTGTCCDV